MDLGSYPDVVKFFSAILFLIFLYFRLRKATCLTCILLLLLLILSKILLYCSSGLVLLCSLGGISVCVLKWSLLLTFGCKISEQRIMVSIVYILLFLMCYYHRSALAATSDIHRQVPTHMANICRDWLTNQKHRRLPCCDWFSRKTIPQSFAAAKIRSRSPNGSAILVGTTDVYKYSSGYRTGH